MVQTVERCPLERRRQMLKILEEKGSVSVKELSELLNISKVSVRSHLKRLEEEGLLIRMRGGAVIPNRSRLELTFAIRERLNIEEKRLIGEAAAQLVQDGESIILDASTTALQVAKRIKDRQYLTVVTNGIYTALELAGCPNITVMLLGGVLRAPSMSLVGPQAEEAISRLHVDRGFFSCRGLTLEAGLCDANIHEVQLKRAMVRACKEVTALVDYSKIGAVSFASFAPVEALHRIITDDRAPDAYLASFRDRGIEVVVCAHKRPFSRKEE